MRKASAALDSDARFMAEAVLLGRSMLGLASPNPAVGCVIVRDGRVIARGATAPGGRPHAETVALGRAGSRARGATAYVSLEPCAHFGQTPPCANALVEAGVARVVVGCVDPFPKVRGRGIQILRRAGIEVTAGVLEDECRRVNEGFFTRIAKGRPFAILKLAMTLDGRIAAASGDSRWISSEDSRDLVHQWRRECDAVIVGAGTVVADNPRLTCRMDGGRDPVRVIVDGRLRSPVKSRVFTQRSTAKTILATTRENLDHARRLYESVRVEVIAVGQPSLPGRNVARNGRISIRALMTELAGRGWNRVMFEGGARVAG
ncbi:MAG TPA: bifunctional diaminohydroxyphosphoribosylaminopyrimidine deaminase/5-amino-6-(5-phosphoribosylamino)uracil reductase RibD, partial [Candidatus Binataceae bacterium]|nr:bifunctional diaminohydroxyphosphoribosylaminopyrimidine deaminase/5-amino-6-(5-phosphoribosylamino)uracil reductase RibD [Candidatus Binataceae bacterium]